MTLTELVLKVRDAVVLRDRKAAFAVLGEVIAAVEAFLDTQGATKATAAGSGLDVAVAELKVACDANDATPALGVFPWGAIVFEIIKVVIDRIGKK